MSVFDFIWNVFLLAGSIYLVQQHEWSNWTIFGAILLLRV